ncbi:RICIN domain-containing protein [Streptomyces rectiverticillatus]|uniref:RICIN domain-containing protein n=1 Tax=Streptomyces rectiverticillatus TaxID=173860 RepID=UPI0015C3A69B|nr:RICIN domain-containing protein [Streptomyces rectiverticillatus]
MRRLRRRPAAWLTALVTVVASAAITVLPTAPAQAAPLRSTPLITYNMLGATSGQDSKWFTTIGNYIEAAQVVTLQEAGPTPPGVPVRIHPFPGLPQTGRAGFVQHHRWEYHGGIYEVYFLQTDRMRGRYVGGRNNVAIVTRQGADEVTAVPSPVADGRAALGVRFGNDWYFTFHARPTGRQNPTNESDQMLARIAAFVNQVPGRSWTVGADFNNEPGNFAVPPGAHRYNSGLPTHENGRELDYVVSSANIPDHPVRRLDGASADHYAVAVGGMRAGGEPHALFTSPRHIENMQSGGTLEALAGGVLNGMPAVTNQRHGGFTQNWDLEFDGTGSVRIRLPKLRCLFPLMDRPDHGKPIMYDCAAGSLERWRLLSFGNEQYQIRSVATGLCLDAGTATTPRDTDHLELAACKAKNSQHWLLAPSAGTDHKVNFDGNDLYIAHPGPFGLENVRTGRMLAGEPRGLSGTRVRAYPHRTRPTPNKEKWVPEWIEAGRLRMRDAASGLCAETDGTVPNNGLLGVDLRACNGSDAQTWRVEPAGENTFRLRNARRTGDDAEACLDVDALSAPTGRDIVNTTLCERDRDSQRWFFAPFDASAGPDETGD